MGPSQDEKAESSSVKSDFGACHKIQLTWDEFWEATQYTNAHTFKQLSDDTLWD